jgi:Domain of unknown function (DUF317)
VAAHGWLRDIDRPGTGAMDTTVTSHISFGEVPPWAASFGSSVPHDLVAAFTRSVRSTAPVLRRTLPESTKDRLLRALAS